MGQVDCFVQCEAVGAQIALDGVQPRDEDALVVSSSYLVIGEPLESPWHLRRHPYDSDADLNHGGRSAVSYNTTLAV